MDSNWEDIVMKSRACLSLIFFLAVIFITSTAWILGFTHESWAATFYVDNSCPSGVGTSGDPFCTIQEGITAAGSGGTVWVEPGAYTETVTITVPVTVLSYTNAAITDYATSLGYTVTVLERAADTIISGTVEYTATGGGTLDGFTIQGPSATSPLIKMTDASPTVQNCIIRNSGVAGIDINGDTGLVAPIIYSNVIDDVGGPGIRLQGDAGPIIGGDTLSLGNHILGNSGGAISSEHDTLTADSGPYTITIQGNNVKNNSGGGIWLHADPASNINVIIGGGAAALGNPISDHDAYTAPAVVLHQLSSATVNYNQIFDNLHALCVMVSDVTTATFQNNTITGCGRAISVSGASATTIGGDPASNLGNTLSNNFAGVFFGNGLVGPVASTGPSSAAVTIRGNQIDSNGLTTTGGGIVVNGDITGAVAIDQNNIKNNRAGIRVKNPCTLTITRNNIHDNTRAGITAEDASDVATITVQKNKIHHNGGEYGAGCNLIDAEGVVENNLFYDNYRAGLVFGQYFDLTLPSSIINNTFAYQIPYGAGLVGGAGLKYYKRDCKDFPDPPAISIKNNILAYNATGGFGLCTAEPCDGSSVTTRDYNLLYCNNGTCDGGNTDCGYAAGVYEGVGISCVNENYGGFGCGLITTTLPYELRSEYAIIANPLFVNAGIDDYQLQGTSPAIDAGDPNPIYDDAGGGRNDMGAYGGPDPLIDADVLPD
jgi:hypothetical protein